MNSFTNKEFPKKKKNHLLIPRGSVLLEEEEEEKKLLDSIAYGESSSLFTNRAHLTRHEKHVDRLCRVTLIKHFKKASLGLKDQ